MPKSTLLAATLAAAAMATTAPALAQGAPSAAKKAQVARILKAQQPDIEGIGRLIAEGPALQMMQQAGAALQQVPAERREAVGRDIDADLRQYVEGVSPGLREAAVRIAPTTIGPILEEKFSEDELKQLAAMVEAPVYRKYIGVGAELQRAMREKLVADSRADIEPKLRKLGQTVAGRLGLTPAAAASAASAAGGKK